MAYKGDSLYKSPVKFSKRQTRPLVAIINIPQVKTVDIIIGMYYIYMVLVTMHSYVLQILRASPTITTQVEGTYYYFS